MAILLTSSSTLSAGALDALKEFYHERDVHVEKFEKLKTQADAVEILSMRDMFKEDWQESQFWVSDFGRGFLPIAGEVVSGIRDADAWRRQPHIYYMAALDSLTNAISQSIRLCSVPIIYQKSSWGRHWESVVWHHGALLLGKPIRSTPREYLTTDETSSTQMIVPLFLQSNCSMEPPRRPPSPLCLHPVCLSQ